MLGTIRDRIKHIAKSENAVNYLDPYGKSAIEFSLLVTAIALLFSPVAVANSARKTKSIPISVPAPDRYSGSPQEKSISNQTIPIEVPQPSDRAVPQILPVPNLPIPKGNLTLANPHFEPEEAVLYRVIVKSQDKELIRSLYPDAFNVIYNGEKVVQVGLFSDRYNAIDARDSLQNLGLDAAIVD